MENKSPISWQAPEFVYYHKSIGWRLGLIAVAVALTAYSIWTKDLLMAITLLVLLAVGYFYSHKEPKSIKITLSGRGITVDGLTHGYSEIKNFWILYQPPIIKTLNFETTDYLNREITLQLEDQDPNEIREYLLQYLTEEIERRESVSDRLLRKLRF